MGLFWNEIEDATIGVLVQAERALIRKAGLRGVLDYGNVSTWIQRVYRTLDAMLNLEPPPGVAPHPVPQPRKGEDSE